MLTIRGRRIVCPDGERPASVHIDGGRIVSIGPLDDAASGEVVDAGDLVVSPGLVDTHVHVNEPGRTEWEGFDTATRAAAAGGVTTIVDMPLNSIPATTTVASLRAKTDAARGRCPEAAELHPGAPRPPPLVGNGSDSTPSAPAPGPSRRADVSVKSYHTRRIEEAAVFHSHGWAAPDAPRAGDKRHVDPK